MGGCGLHRIGIACAIQRTRQRARPMTNCACEARAQPLCYTAQFSNDDPDAARLHWHAAVCMTRQHARRDNPKTLLIETRYMRTRTLRSGLLGAGVVLLVAACGKGAPTAQQQPPP